MEEDINALSNATISGSIDVTDLPEGAHQLPLTLDVDGTKYTYSDVKVSVIIGDDPIEWPGTDAPGTESEE